ncbi:hypothetical protein BGX27_005936 [Mortierella sp. AM989]|nr:hypothetical protein BGX27_005936 [Mortierella sp. AM989]
MSTDNTPVSDVPSHSRRHSLPTGKSFTFRRLFKTSSKHRDHSHPIPASLDIVDTSAPSLLMSYTPSSSSSPPSSSTLPIPTNLHNTNQSPQVSRYSTSSDRGFPSPKSNSDGSLARLKRSFTLKAKNRRVGDEPQTPTTPHSTAHEDKLRASDTVVIHPLDSYESEQTLSDESFIKRPNKLRRWQSKSATKLKNWLHLPHENHNHHVHQSHPRSDIHHSQRYSGIQESTLPEALSEVASQDISEHNLYPVAEFCSTSNQSHSTNTARFRSTQKHRINHYRRRSDFHTIKDRRPIQIPKRSSSLPKSFRSALPVASETSSSYDDTSSELKADIQERQLYVDILEDVAEDSAVEEQEAMVIIECIPISTPTSTPTPTSVNCNLGTISFAASLPLPCSNPASPTSEKPETLFSDTHVNVDQFDQRGDGRKLSECLNDVEEIIEQMEHSMDCIEPRECPDQAEFDLLSLDPNNDQVLHDKQVQEVCDQVSQVEQVVSPILALCTNGALEPCELGVLVEQSIEDRAQVERVEELMQQVIQTMEDMEQAAQINSQALLAEKSSSSLCSQQSLMDHVDQQLPDSERFQPARFDNDTNLDFFNDTQFDIIGVAYSESSLDNDPLNNSTLCGQAEPINEGTTLESVPATYQYPISTIAVSSELLQSALTASSLSPLPELTLDEPLSKSNSPATIPTLYQGLVVETLNQMYPSAAMRWHYQPQPCPLSALSFWSSSNTYPGQVDCKRVGCSFPINVDKEAGIRHPFCSIQCAIACGENPRVRTPVAKTPPPAYNTNGYALPLNRVPSMSMDGSQTCYISPPATDDSPHHSDEESKN